MENSNLISIPGFTDPVSSITHLMAALAALVLGIRLCVKGKGNATRMVSLGVFVFSAVFLFSMSGVYHLLERGGTPRLVMQRMDYAAIWVLIAGTFTPLHVILLRGFWRWGALIFVWIVAVNGIVFTTVFFTDIPHSLSIGMYISMGYFGILSGYKVYRRFGFKTFRWIAAGGVAYTIGALGDLIKFAPLIPGVLGPHEIFHLFVIMGWGFHFYVIYICAHEPLWEDFVFKVQSFPNNHFVAKAAHESMIIEAQGWENLKSKVKAAVSERYKGPNAPQRLHFKISPEEWVNL